MLFEGFKALWCFRIGSVEPVGEQTLRDGLNQLETSERGWLADSSVVPPRGKNPFPAILDTEEQADSYLSSIEKTSFELPRSDAGDLQVFVKGVMSNATRGQRI